MNELVVLESTVYFKTNGKTYDEALSELFHICNEVGIEINITMQNSEMRTVNTLTVRNMITYLLDSDMDKELIVSIKQNDGNYKEYKASFVVDYEREFNDPCDRVIGIVCHNEHENKSEV